MPASEPLRQLKGRAAAHAALAMAFMAVCVAVPLRRYTDAEAWLWWLAPPLIVWAAALGWIRTKQPITPASLVLEPDGVTIERPCQRTTIKWNDVLRVATWKDDLFGVDCICLGFSTTAAPDTLIVTDEDMAGWAELMAAANARFGLDPEWHVRVMHPAFEQNYEELWTRPEEKPHASSACAPESR